MSARERRYILRSLFCPGSFKFWSLKTDCARLVYLALLAHADDNGCVECDHQGVKSMTPRSQYTRTMLTAAVQGIVKNGLGATYREGKKLYMKINGFEQSQSGQVVSWGKEEIPQPATNGNEIANSLPNKLTLPNRSKQITPAEERESAAGNAFAEAKRKFRRAVGKSIGSLGNRGGEWSGIVAKHGAETLIAAIAIWAKENREFLKGSTFPLAHFLKNHMEYIEAVGINAETDAAAATEETMGVEDIRPPGYQPPAKPAPKVPIQ